MTVKLLIVDGTPDLEFLTRRSFFEEIRDGRCEILRARTGLEALERLREDRLIEIVVCDLDVREMDGLSLLARLPELNNPILKTVVVADQGDVRRIREAMNRGASDFLTRPVDTLDVGITLRKTIDQLAILKAALATRDRLVSLQRELHIARGIQQAILPQKFPPFPERTEFELLAEMIPAREVGGDFYDFFLLDDARLGFVIADVSGKGIPAAIFMAMSRALLKATALTGLPPGECLSHVNNLLCSESQSGLFVTMVYGILHFETGLLETCFGGHPAPYLLRPGGDVQPIPGESGMVLGILEDTPYPAQSFQLEPGDVLYLFTDGVTEAMNAQESFYSEERLEEYLRRANGAPLDELLQGTLDEVNAFAAGAPQADDVTLLAVKYR